MALVPQMVDALQVPVIAAGGIMDGRGVLAALALGAEAVQLGTRFLLASESGTFPAYRQRLIEGTETDTVVTRSLRRVVVVAGRTSRHLEAALVRACRDNAIATLILCLVQRAIGRTQQSRSGLSMLGKRGNAKRDRDRTD